MEKVTGILKALGNVISENRSSVLCGIGIASMTAGTIIAAKISPSADLKIRTRRAELGVEKLGFRETFKTIWKDYAPVAACTTVGAASMILSTVSSNKKMQALTAACTAIEGSYTVMKDKIKETVGEEKAREIEYKTGVEKAEKNVMRIGDKVIAEGTGPHLICDSYTGKFFYSDVESIKAAANEVNFSISNGMSPWASLNEFYSKIDGVSMVGVGDQIGWNASTGCIDLSFTSDMLDGRIPYIMMEYYNEPSCSFRDL